MSKFENINKNIENTIESFIEGETDFADTLQTQITEILNDFIRHLSETKGDMASFSIDLESLTDAFLEQLDVEELAGEITSNLTKSVLRYMINAGVPPCPECKRSFGNWMSEQQGSIGDHLVSTQGKTILIIDDV